MKGDTNKFDLLGEINELRPDLNTSNVQLPMTNGTAEDWLQKEMNFFRWVSLI